MKDPIVQEGDPVLRTEASSIPAAEITSPKIKKLIKHMKDVLGKEEFGVALAAPQVGESLRLFVIAGRVFKEDKDESPTPPDKVFINPILSRLSRKKAEMSEGCLSVRSKYGTVMRHEKASIKALDENGSPFTYHGTGLIAHIFQHECDHLEGILYTDKAIQVEADEDLKSARRKLKDIRGV